MDKISPARRIAFKILLDVLTSDAHSDQLLRANAVSKLPPADRNLTQALVLGVLRWQLALDARIRPHLSKPNAKIDAPIRVALRLGACQILLMDRIPARAAIDESVELTKAAGHKFASGLVNAVLRKLAAAEGAPALSPIEAYPEWMLARWTAHFGAEAAASIAAHGQSHPATALRLPTPESEAALLEAGAQFEPGSLLTQARTLRPGAALDSKTLRASGARIQDEGSQLVAELAPAGRSILDCCAAPGGKTMLLAERNPKARIVANEVSEARLGPLRKRLLPFGERVECRLSDAGRLNQSAQYDLILADVPCSGTGTLGRNPEIRYRITEEDLARQAERQRAILQSAAQALRPGGKLLYSTCSLEPEENEQVVAAVLEACPALRQITLAPRIGELAAQRILSSEEQAQKLVQALTPEGALRLLPGALGTDGFFVALLEKQ